MQRLGFLRLFLVTIAAASAAAMVFGIALGLGSPYGASFDGAPSAPLAAAGPQSAVLADWDVQVHSRDARYNLEAMEADHGSDCGAPPLQHHLSGNFSDAVFQCKNHVMTAIKAGGYGVVYLTPDDLADFSGGATTISFDVSTARTSTRDFLSVWLVPYEDNMALPLDEWLPDLQGVPRNAIHIRMDNFGSGSGFRVDLIRNYTVTPINTDLWSYYEQILTPSAATRTTFQLRVSKTHVKFGIPGQASTGGKSMWWADTAIPPLEWSSGLLQLGHHSYNPDKACGGCRANTWHWDNVTMSSATPITMIKANQRFVDGNGQTVTFRAPAPANAKLRFAALGTVSVSFDDGATWTPGVRQPGSAEVKGDHHPEHFSSYWMPIPAGVSSVTFRFAKDGWYEGGFMAQDFSIMSDGTAGAPSPSATPSATTTATPGELGPVSPLPIAAVTSTPTATPTALSSAVAVPTSTVPPSSSPTPTTTAKATATPAAAWSASAGTTIGTVSAGKLNALIRSTVAAGAATDGIVNIEIFAPNGQRIYEWRYAKQAFVAGETYAFDLKYSGQAPSFHGDARIKITVFSPTYKVLFSNANAGILKVP